MPAESFVYSFGGWDLVEVTDSADQVMGFWGIPRVPVAVGNIRRIWFESLPGDDWNVWAFEPIAIQARVYALAYQGASTESIAFLMSREFMAADTAVNLEVDGGAEGLLVKGFIVGDPLTEPVASLDDPKAMVDLLASIAYPVAPELTDLLVDGTAGASVGMNPATKATLDCLRSTNTACGECVCVKTEAMIVTTPWTVYENHMPDGRIRCHYTRTEHHFYWLYGEDPDNNCEDCTAGSADNPIPYDVVVEYTEYWADIEHCPDAPLGF